MKRKANKEKMKICLVGSSGGHLTHLYMLKPFWKDKDRFWVTFDKSHFLNSDGSNNYETVVDRITNILKEHGFEECNTIQKIADIMIYPSEYFCPMEYETGKLNVTENSYTIHWYDASWLDERMKRRRARNVKIRNTIDGKIGIRLSKIYMTGSYYWEWITTGKWSIIKQKLQSKGKLFK